MKISPINPYDSSYPFYLGSFFHLETFRISKSTDKLHVKRADEKVEPVHSAYHPTIDNKIGQNLDLSK